jgi:hypothetical protein
MGQSPFLLICGGINALLHNATSMFVTCNLNTLVYHSVVQELVSRLFPALQNLLNNMISIDIFTHFFDSVHEIALNQSKMFINFGNFNEFLNRPSSMSIFAECNWFVSHLFYNLCELFFITVVS